MQCKMFEESVPMESIEVQHSGTDNSPSQPPPDSGRKTNLKAGLILLALTVVFYWKIILVQQYSMLLGFEGANQAYAWFNFWLSTIRQGSWPLWDPFTFSGRPFAGETQTGAFYPLYLIFLAGPFHHGIGMLSQQVYHVFFVLTHALCAWFMYLLAREFRLSVFAGLVAGICFSLGGVLTRFGGWPHMLQSGIWLPLIVVLLMRAIKASNAKSTVAYSALCGLALALAVLAGGFHVVMMDTIVVLSVVVFHTAQGGPAKAWRRAALVIGVCGAFAFAGGAVQLLSSIEFSRQALRSIGPIWPPATQRIPYNYLGDALWAHSFLGLVVPVFAGSFGSGEYADPYLGVFPILMAVIAIWKRWACMWVRYLAGLIVATCLYCLGPTSLLHGFLYAVTPWPSVARETDRFMYLADFGLAILAGFGVDALFTRLPLSSWQPLGGVLKWIAVACVAALAWKFVLGHGDLETWISFSLLLILLTYGVFLYIIHGHHGSWARFLAIALILFDLNAFDWSAANKIVAAANHTDEMSKLYGLEGVVDFLRSQPGTFRVQMAVNPAPNIGDMFGVEETWGTGVMIQRDYAQFHDRADLLNVRYTIRPASASEPNPVYQDSAWKIYPNPNAYPRAWLVHETAVEPDADKLSRRLDAPGTDTHRIALLAAPLGFPLDAPSAAGVEQATPRKSARDRVDVGVHADGRALLVLSELFYPGWKATVNGKPVQIVKVDGALRGILVPSGDSKVSLKYSPVSFFAGLGLTLAAFLCGAFLCFRLRGDNWGEAA
jgi:hypothetical protein